MSVVKTTEDGWDCVPELAEAVYQMSRCDAYVYEISNCVRDHSLDVIVNDMKEHLQNAIDRLDEIDIDVKYKTEEI
tara:strand:+ start:291 stop:518 length:228 start_codon:yes stop_codon:yes gene_type:complete